MPPIRGKKRKSVEEEENTQDITMGQKVPTKTGSPPASQESPHKKRKTGITIAQKQALIDNLQLEITERARKLRANYNIHAQSLRTRIEIRVNRIPLSLRRAKMGDLLQKYSAEGQQKAGASATRGPPVPEKDILHNTLSRYPLQRTAHMLAMGSPAHMIKRGSRDISGPDKENSTTHLDSPKKARLGPAAEIARNPAQVLSPASSNSRLAPRGTAAPPPTTNLSPIKSGIARPVSPTKPPSSNLLTNMVEKASRATRPAPASSTTKRSRANTTSTIPSSSSSDGAARATRTRGTAAASSQPSRPPTRTAPRVSGISESSDGSTSTVVRKRPGTAMSTKSAPGGTSSSSTTAKRNVISTIKKGVAASTSRKAPASSKTAAAPASTTSTGRVLRKRG